MEILTKKQIEYVNENFNLDTIEPERIEFLDNSMFIEFIVGNARRGYNYEGEGMTIEECIFQSILIHCNYYAFRNAINYLNHFISACIDNEFYEIASNCKELIEIIENKMSKYQLSV